MTCKPQIFILDDDDEQVPQRDEAKLKEMRNNMAMELLWIQQAIESRKNVSTCTYIIGDLVPSRILFPLIQQNMYKTFLFRQDQGMSHMFTKFY